MSWMVMIAMTALFLHGSAIEQVATTIESRSYTLRIDLHEPETKGASMQAPTLERRGWHHHNPAGPVVLRAGERVEVTGVFNYAERGLFVELSGDGGGSDDSGRPRLRVRVMVETPGDNPSGQAAEALELIGRVLDLGATP